MTKTEVKTIEERHNQMERDDVCLACGKKMSVFTTSDGIQHTICYTDNCILHGIDRAHLTVTLTLR